MKTAENKTTNNHSFSGKTNKSFFDKSMNGSFFSEDNTFFSPAFVQTKPIVNQISFNNSKSADTLPKQTVEGKQQISHISLGQQRIMRRVRGMVEEQPEGRPVSSDEWPTILEALQLARQMVQSTVRFLNGIHNLLLPGADPRLYSERENRAARMFRIHYRNPGGIHALEAHEYYGYILGALNRLNQNSFRAVTQQQADSAPDDNTWAYVIGRRAIIYLTEGILPRTSRSRISSVQAGGLEIELFARLLIHETSHFRLGATHRGNDRLRMEDVNCEQGLPIPSADDALQNAYIYGHFPYCVSQITR